MMNPEVKTKWLEALRSGDYPKGKDTLCENGQYCCLGVLADIENLFTREVDGTKYVGTYSSAILTREQEEHYFKDHLDDVGHLMRLNDSTETFAEVIEYIEQKL